MASDQAMITDLGHECVPATCLAHHRRVWTGGIDHDWLHQDRTVCSTGAWEYPARTGGEVFGIRELLEQQQKITQDREAARLAGEQPARPHRVLQAEPVQEDGGTVWHVPEREPGS